MNTKHMPLIVAIALPITFVIILALVILLPNTQIKPSHDFIYTTATNDQYGYYDGRSQYKNTYDLKEDKITLKPLIIPTVSKDPYMTAIAYENAPPIYYYDIENQTSKEISLEEAQKLSLIKGPSSPDGYSISYSTSHEGIFELFGSNNSTSFVITKGRGSKVLNGVVGYENYYRMDLNIIGWIK